MISLTLRFTEEKDVTVMRCLELPNIIVQGKDLQDAKKNFVKAVEYFFKVGSRLERQQDPLLSNEKEDEIKVRFSTVDPLV